jgi:hypothetical protein
MAVTIDTFKTRSQGLYVGSFAFAALPPAASYPNGEAFVSDWGATGTKVRSNGTRWLPMGGRALLKHLGPAQSGVGSTSTIVLQSPQLPAGLIQTGDLILFDITGMAKNGTTDNGVLDCLVGTAGTTADTSLLAGAAVTAMAAANQTADAMLCFKVVSSTSAQRVGVQNGSGLYGGGGVSTVAAPVAVTVPNLSSSAVFLSFAIASSGATNTMAIQEGSIWHVAG